MIILYHLVIVYCSKKICKQLYQLLKTYDNHEESYCSAGNIIKF